MKHDAGKTNPTAERAWKAVQKMTGEQLCYNEDRKKLFASKAKSVLRGIQKALPEHPGSIRYNPGGIAVGGDITLHTTHVYITINGDMVRLGVMGRTCMSEKDYTGGCNQWFDYRGSYPELVDFVLRIYNKSAALHD